MGMGEIFFENLLIISWFFEKAILHLPPKFIIRE
jgi:hypothetical protein